MKTVSLSLSLERKIKISKTFHQRCFFAFSILLGSFLSLGSVLAQQSTAAQTPNLGSLKTALVATVNIYDAKIVSQEGNVIKVGFDLSNRINAQPGVKYGINLVKVENEKNKTLVDEKVYDESVYLGENFLLHKEIEYQAPTFLSGTYEVWIISKNEKGLRLSIAKAGDISLNGDNQYLNQIQEQCYLTIKGDKENKKYQPDQGVDISSNETLLATCPVKNNFSNTTEAFPVLTTFYRDSFGEKVSEKKENTLSLQAQEEKTLSFEIPTVSKPQAYDTKITFFNSQGEAISNSVKFHYIIQGESATFQNLTLDRDYYQSGDEAKLSIFWSPSADSFSGSRKNKNDKQDKILNIVVSNSIGEECAKKFSVSIDSDQINPKEYKIPITKECVDPKIETTISDKNGNVLDQNTSKIKTQDVERKRQLSEISKKEKAERMKKISLAVFIIFISIISILLIIKIFIKKRKNIGKTMLFLLFFSSSFIFANNAHGDTFTIYGRRCSGSVYDVTMCKIFGGGVGISYTMNIGTDKSTYTPGETIAATGSMPFVDACSNIATNAYLTGNINDSGDVDLYKGSVNSGGAINIYAPWFSAPGSGGNYNANFNLYINWDDPVTWGHMDGEINTSYKVAASCACDPSIALTVCSGSNYNNICGEPYCPGAKNCSTPPPSSCGLKRGFVSGLRDLPTTISSVSSGDTVYPFCDWGNRSGSTAYLIKKGSRINCSWTGYDSPAPSNGGWGPADDPTWKNYAIFRCNVGTMNAGDTVDAHCAQGSCDQKIATLTPKVVPRYKCSNYQCIQASDGYTTSETCDGSCNPPKSIIYRPPTDFNEISGTFKINTDDRVFGGKTILESGIDVPPESGYILKWYKKHASTGSPCDDLGYCQNHSANYGDDQECATEDCGPSRGNSSRLDLLCISSCRSNCVVADYDGGCLTWGSRNCGEFYWHTKPSEVISCSGDPDLSEGSLLKLKPSAKAGDDSIFLEGYLGDAPWHNYGYSSIVERKYTVVDPANCIPKQSSCGGEAEAQKHCRNERYPDSLCGDYICTGTKDCTGWVEEGPK